MSYLRTFDSWADGVKQTLNPDGTNAGLNVGAHTADPSAPVNGDVWYQSTANELRARINGATVALGAGGASPPFTDTNALIAGSGDPTKLLRFEIDGFTTATTRVLTPPNQNATIAGLEVAQTFTVDQIFATAITAGNTLFNVTATTGVLRLSNGTDPAANPTNATTQWAVGGEWQYRSSAASEGAGQTNRVHNRAEQAQGAGTDYALTNSSARIDFGTSDPEIVLPTAGTYELNAVGFYIADVLGAADLVQFQMRNSTDSVFIGSPINVSAYVASGQFAAHLSALITVTASKTIQLWGYNAAAARGTVLSNATFVRYKRLY